MTPAQRAAVQHRASTVFNFAWKVGAILLPIVATYAVATGWRFSDATPQAQLSRTLQPMRDSLHTTATTLDKLDTRVTASIDSLRGRADATERKLDQIIRIGCMGLTPRERAIADGCRE